MDWSARASKECGYADDADAGLIGSALRSRFMLELSALGNVKADKVDWHPGSNGLVQLGSSIAASTRGGSHTAHDRARRAGVSPSEPTRSGQRAPLGCDGRCVARGSVRPRPRPRSRSRSRSRCRRSGPRTPSASGPAATWPVHRSALGPVSEPLHQELRALQTAGPHTISLRIQQSKSSSKSQASSCNSCRHENGPRKQSSTIFRLQLRSSSDLRWLSCRVFLCLLCHLASIGASKVHSCSVVCVALAGAHRATGCVAIRAPRLCRTFEHSLGPASNEGRSTEEDGQTLDDPKHERGRRRARRSGTASAAPALRRTSLNPSWIRSGARCHDMVKLATVSNITVKS